MKVKAIISNWNVALLCLWCLLLVIIFSYFDVLSLTWLNWLWKIRTTNIESNKWNNRMRNVTIFHKYISDILSQPSNRVDSPTEFSSVACFESCACPIIVVTWKIILIFHFRFIANEKRQLIRTNDIIIIEICEKITNGKLKNLVDKYWLQVNWLVVKVNLSLKRINFIFEIDCVKRCSRAASAPPLCQSQEATLFNLSAVSSPVRSLHTLHTTQYSIFFLLFCVLFTVIWALSRVNSQHDPLKH